HRLRQPLKAVQLSRMHLLEPTRSASGLTAREAHRGEFEANKLRKRLRRLVGRAIANFSMIEAGDRVMVCVSGGKDSYGLLDILLSLKDSATLHLDLISDNIDQKHSEYPAAILQRSLAQSDVPIELDYR